MTANDVIKRPELASTASGCDQAYVWRRPRLLTEDGTSYIATDLADWLEKRKIEHTGDLNPPGQAGRPMGQIGQPAGRNWQPDDNQKRAWRQTDPVQRNGTTSNISLPAER